MNTYLQRWLFGVSAIATVAAIAPSAQAFTWTYGWDSAYDGTGSFIRDGLAYNANGVATKSAAHGVGIYSQYEHFGMAYTATEDTVTFAFNSNLALNGWASSSAKDGNIGWGDLFLNTDSSLSFAEAQAQGKVLGIRFAGQNDSGVDATANNGYYGKETYLDSSGRTKTRNANTYDGTTGVFSGVTAKSVTGVNHGWSDYTSFNNYVQKQTIKENGKNVYDATGKAQKGQVELIDGLSLAASQAYLGTYGAGVINTSEARLGDITLLDYAQLSAMGLDFGASAAGQTLGTQTIGFSFARSLLPGGELNWIAHVMAECSNDTMGMAGQFMAVPPPKDPHPVTPEPSVTLGLLAMLLGAWQTRGRHKGM